MAAAQQLANYVGTTLAAACTSGATVLTLTSVAGLPTIGNFMLRIDDAAPAVTFEYVEVTSVNVGASQVTCTRGQEGTTGIAHSIGAIVGNDLTAAMLQRAFAMGVPAGGYSQAVADQGLVGATLTDLTSAAVTVTLLAGRRYKIHGHSGFASTVADGQVALSIQEGATQLGQGVDSPNLANASITVDAWADITPTAGAHTYKLTMQRLNGSGTVTAKASAVAPLFIEIQDVGQA